MVRALVVKVLDRDGREVEKVEVDADLLELVLKRKKDLGTDFFGRILSSMFNGNPKMVTVTDENNTNYNRAFYIFAREHTDSHCYGNLGTGTSYYGTQLFTWIAVGAGSTDPARNNIKLELELDREPASASYTDGTGVVVISAAFTFPDARSISEVGLLLCPSMGGCGSSGNCVLADRTVLSTPVSVSPGQSLYIEYRIAI